ncbi:MAG: hypothetical protein L6R28_21590 [Planctomycetes bacterium]|nr:hypothetical protein [Planctomycetota bacterium]
MYNFCGGDPVNRSDPMGTDFVTGDDGETIRVQGESPMGINVGMSMPVGKRNGDWIELSETFGKGQISYWAFKQYIEAANRGEADVSKIRVVIRNCLREGARVSETPVEDAFVNVPKAVTAPIRAVSNTAILGAYAALNGERADTTEFRTLKSAEEDPFFGRSEVYEGVSAQLDARQSRAKVFFGDHLYDGLLAQMVGRSNPVSGTFIGTYNATLAAESGDWGTASSESTGVATHFAMASVPLKSGGQNVVPYGRLPIDASQLSFPTAQALFIKVFRPGLVAEMRQEALAAAQQSGTRATSVFRQAASEGSSFGVNGRPLATPSILGRLNSFLFGESLDRWAAGNCAEPHAVNGATSTRNGLMYTVRNDGMAMPRCRQCQITTGDVITLSDPTPPTPVLPFVSSSPESGQ